MTPKRCRTEGGRSTGTTYDSGPMKPGNSVEDKTLKIRKMYALHHALNISSLSGIWEAVDERCE